MKRNMFIIIGICFGFTLFANDIQTQQDSATASFIAGDYEQSLNFYLDLDNKEYSSPEMYFNMGNCYYQIEDIASSILYYEKALVIDPNNKDIKHNLEIANSKVKSKVEALPKQFYKRWYNSIVSSASSDFWAILGIVCFVIALSSILIYFFSNKTTLRKVAFALGIAGFVISIFAIVFSVNMANRITENKFAIVFDTSLVKNTPSKDGDNSFEIDEGLKVEITDSLNNYYNIKLEDGKQGWILAENIKKI